MFTRGNYMMKVVYFKGEKQWLVKNKRKGREYHTHVPYHLLKAAQMIVVRADEGVIPADYPNWMIESINRVWYGKDYKDRKDICNDNQLTNDPDVRFLRNKKKKGNKGYVNNPRR